MQICIANFQDSRFKKRYTVRSIQLDHALLRAIDTHKTIEGQKHPRTTWVSKKMGSLLFLLSFTLALFLLAFRWKPVQDIKDRCRQRRIHQQLLNLLVIRPCILQQHTSICCANCIHGHVHGCEATPLNRGNQCLSKRIQGCCIVFWGFRSNSIVRKVD